MMSTINNYNMTSTNNSTWKLTITIWILIRKREVILKSQEKITSMVTIPGVLEATLVEIWLKFKRRDLLTVIVKSSNKRDRY